ncbi:MAG: hypothetical protein HY706_14255, partial [Candidatus Hydrogenedentes bacterium]|nr:hypothetical protein [Candidatus Hydrogenedentota bacterium]
MAKGTLHDCERVFFRDPRSGLKITRLTHHPCISMNLYFEMCSFTEDDGHVVFLSQRYAGREAPFDLFRVQTNGMDLVQLTDCDDIGGIAVCPTTDSAYYLTRGELRRVHVKTLEEETIARVPGERPTAPRSLATIDLKGKRYFGNVVNKEGRGSLFRVDTDTGKVTLIHESDTQNHITVD